MTDATEPRAPRERRKNLYIGLTALFIVLYSVSVGVDLAFGVRLYWITAPLIVAAVGCACLWMLSLDEMHMQAHYVSWYWGGSLGLMVSALVYLAVFPRMQQPGSFAAMFPRELAPILPDLSFHAGFLLGVMPAVLGYLIWWGGVTLRNR